jgi:DNA-binding NarL/FixJ family response regulator
MVLTTSQAEDDIARSYALHANAYVSTPVGYHPFSEAVRQINDFSLTVAELSGLSPGLPKRKTAVLPGGMITPIPAGLSLASMFARSRTGSC